MSEARSGSIDTHAVEELIFLVDRGSVFYETLGEQSKDLSVRQVCVRMAQAKAALARSLGSRRRAAGSAAPPSTPDPYARLPAEVTRPALEELEAIEDRLLRAFEGAIAGGETAAVRDALKSYLPQSQSCHAELRRLAGGKGRGGSLKRRSLADWLPGRRPRG